MNIKKFPDAPTLLFSGYSGKKISRTRRTEFENGSIRQAPRSALTLQERNVTYYCCSPQVYDELIDFIDITLANGSLYFLWHSTERGNAGAAPIIRARIKDGAYDVEPQNDELTEWHVKFTLEYWK
jgi:hypothetical protein